MQDKVVSRRETAARLNISLRTLDRLARNGDGPRRIQISERRYGYPESELQAYVQRKLQASVPQNV
jgi:predicted DNA-binding transcriptional regulator AlpA